MSRHWITAALAVGGVAALKTAIVLHFALPEASTQIATVSAVFAFFYALTAGVAYVSFTQVRKLLDRQRREKLAPGAGEPVAKETIVLRYAPDWGLSQAEADVAIFVAKGFSNSEIADMRGCAVATVKSQLGRIYTKSGLESRYQLIAFVTDEVCAMANDPAPAKVQHSTQTMLPLGGRRRAAA